jgi:hypothetical protein
VLALLQAVTEGGSGMNYHGKASKGRNTHASGAKVPDVESLPCAGTVALGTNHRLRNRVEFREVVTRCDGCGETWAQLDAEARAS